MTVDELERFEGRVAYEPTSGCWLWAGAVTTLGYGRVIGSRTSGRRVRLAHRVSFEHFRGEIPEGMCVCHKCDVPACVNPDHLWLGTQADNLRDMVEKGRHGSKTKPESQARGARHGWTTRPESRPKGSRNGRAKLTENDVREIRAAREQGAQLRPLAARFGVSKSLVDYIVRRVVWAHV